MPWYKSPNSLPPEEPPPRADSASAIRWFGVMIAAAGLLWAFIAGAAPLVAWPRYPNCSPEQMRAIVAGALVRGPVWVVVVGLAVIAASNWISKRSRP
jgi:hypothetical protein